jgi:hypothetical protein
MGRLGRKHKSGTGWNRRTRHGNGGFGVSHGYRRGSAIPTDGTPVPDEDVVTHDPLCTDATQIPIAPTVPRSVETSTDTTYLAPFKKSSFSSPSTNPVILATLEMQVVEYCSFLTSLAKHGSNSKSQLPSLVVKVQKDKIIVTLELANANELEELQGIGMSVTVSLY